MPHLQFWFEFASTYSYLAAMRVDALAQEAHVSVQYQPFLLGPIFASQGLKTSPFEAFPVKGRYMWRDMARLCEEYALPFKQPSDFPRNGLSAARIALVGTDKAWGKAFVQGVYRENFGEDRDISRVEVLREILQNLDLGDQDVDEVCDTASSAALKQRLREQTTEAQALGIFGAPSFVVDRELFWGHDRMPQALGWAKNSRR